MTCAGIDVTQVFTETVEHGFQTGRPFAWAVRQAARDAGDGFVDAEALHLCARDLGFTYVQHTLRETPHICRHTLGDRKYRVHSEPVCSADCDEKYLHTEDRKATATRACGSCGIHAPLTQQTCDFCDTELPEAA